MARITWDGPASVTCEAETTYWPDCPLAEARQRAHARGDWSLYGQLERESCGLCALSTSEAACGWSGLVDVVSDGHQVRFTCPRCQQENTLEGSEVLA